MQEVDLYIRTTAKGPSIRKEAKYLYILKAGEAERQGSGIINNVTENQITLSAINEALGRFKEGCLIRIYTQCEHVLNSCVNHWPEQWQKNGWIKNNSKPVKNSELWQQFMEVSRPHLIEWHQEDHEYSMWMDNEMKGKH